MIAEKTWSKELEKPMVEQLKKSPFAWREQKGKKSFSIDTPPPYVNTPIHIGHATTYAIMDFFARYKRMQGYNVLFPLGLDRNGLPIEMAAEKRYGKKLFETSREEFLKMCEKVLQEASLESIDSFQKLGISFNSWNVGTGIGEIYLTDSRDYRSLTQSTFIELYSKGLVYEDKRINNYCPGCQTTLADAEVEYAELNTFFNDVKFKVKETGEEIVIGTTRPELICTCGMVIFNPADERYKRLDGLTAVTPIFEREVPIRAHPMAEIEKGTGLVMMCSAGDLSDIRFFREKNLPLVIAIDKDGRMNANAGFLKGLQVKEARKRIIEELQNRSLLVKQTQVVHRTPICERSKDAIEFIEMTEYYLKQLDQKEKMKEIANKVNFFAPESRQILLDWIDSISIDWPLTRRRYYATEVPLWYCTKCNFVYVPEKGRYYQPWLTNPPIKKCPKCGNSEFRGDERVFDTWFDSSITPLYILKWSRNEKFFKQNFPCTLRPQGKEIIRTWLYYTLLKCYLLTEKIIFRDAWINYHIIDEKGYKMSKSKGNVTDPHDILGKFGAEPFRLWSALEGNLEKTDFRCSFERIESHGKTLTKLWNVARYISQFQKPKTKKPRLEQEDKWIISELNSIIEYSIKEYDNYNFHGPSEKIRHFLWETFASHYLEMVKCRAYNKDKKFKKATQEAAVWTLYYCLEKVLLLWAPVIPFITQKLFRAINKGKEIHLQEFPQAEKKQNAKLPFTTAELIELNGKIWQAKKEQGKALNTEIESFEAEKKFKPIAPALQRMHSIKELKLK